MWLPPAPRHGPSTRFRRPLTTHGASTAVQSPCTFPSSLAGTGGLVVPTRPYVVRAAPGLAPNPGSGLPSTSTGHCDDRRRASQPARNISASRRTPHLIEDQQGGDAQLGQPVGEAVLLGAAREPVEQLGDGEER